MNLTSVRNGVVTALQTISGLTASGREPGPITPPHAWISDLTVAPDSFGPDSHQITLTLTVVVTGADTDLAHQKLDDFISTGGIETALQGTLSGSAYTCRVRQFYNIGATVKAGNIDYPAFNVDVEIDTD